MNKFSCTSVELNWRFRRAQTPISRNPSKRKHWIFSISLGTIENSNVFIPSFVQLWNNTQLFTFRRNILLLPSVCLTKLLVIFKPPSTKLCSHEAWSLLTSCLTLSPSQSVSPSPYSHLSLLLVPLSLILSYLSPSCCLSLPFSPLSSSLFVPGSNKYLSRPCSCHLGEDTCTHRFTPTEASLL